ncbi:MAG: Trm112 family protein [Mycobacterium sp.]|nr:Trm112 family protein [Mycobacterium sp.]
MVDSKLLSILVCPLDRGPLLLIDSVASNPVLATPVLYNPRLHKAYRIQDDIPVLLVDDAVDVGPEEHARLMDRATGD